MRISPRSQRPRCAARLIPIPTILSNKSMPFSYVECLRTGNDQIAAIVNQLCVYLVIAITRT